jgi:crotonobetainyl-CoA:carnitine CoA-transferase CaiB-like acyl-CoA transferase
VASVPQSPLQGLRVFELGTLIAAPLAGTRWIGPRLGAHTPEVLRELGCNEARERALRDNGVIA